MDGYGDWLVSADDHVIEPPHLWQEHVPARWRGRAPRVVVDDDGTSRWEFEGTREAISALSAVAGTPSEEWDPRPMDLERPRFASYNEPRARLEAMDEDRVIASMLFPTYTGFCGRRFITATDKDLALVCVQAYNDWMLDEWSATAPDRFIPLALVPMWDVELAVAEARRAAAKGARAISFSENPSKLGLPSIHDRARRYWDPLFAACVEHAMPLAMHIGSSSEIRSVSPDAPLIEGATFMSLVAQDTVIDWIWSGNLLRFPELRIVLSESGIDWAPPTIERMRRVLYRWRWARSGGTTYEGNPLTGDPRPVDGRTPFGDIPEGLDPLQVFHDSVFLSMVADDSGWAALDYLGTDNVLIETDFPHPDSSFPHSATIVGERLEHLAEDQRAAVLRDNACREFGFTPAPPEALPIG
jgi:predicted TIM-barrel fold metal-dependent hydrolase